MSGKCPKCERMIRPDLERGPVGNQVSGPLVSGFIAVCPNAGCRTILGVLPDPDAIAEFVISKLSKTR